MSTSNISTHKVFETDHTAVITGASSGIGRAAAIECALMGMHVWMVDVDEDELKRSKEDVLDKVANSYIGQVSTHCLDYDHLNTV